MSSLDAGVLICRGASVEAGLRPAGRSEAASPHGQVSVSGRVEGQILRSSLQQKKDDETPKDLVTFEKAFVQ